MNIEFWSRRFQEFHFGQFVLAKFWWIISMVNALILISIKWDFDPIVYIVPMAIIILVVTWLFGRLLEKSGFREYFQKASFKNVIK